MAESSGFKLYEKPRGAPENVGSELKAIHPVVRTNPVTGWKSIYPVGGHVKHINGLAEEESSKLLSWFLDLVHKNHDLQVRLKWKSPNDIGKSCPASPGGRPTVVLTMLQQFGTTGRCSTPRPLTTRTATMASGSGTEQWAWASGHILIPTALRGGPRQTRLD